MISTSPKYMHYNLLCLIQWRWGVAPGYITAAFQAASGGTAKPWGGRAAGATTPRDRLAGGRAKTQDRLAGDGLSGRDLLIVHAYLT